MEALNWEALQTKQIPNAVFLSVIFHTLTLPELEKFAGDDKPENPKRQLVQHYYTKCFVLSPPTDAYQSPYNYGPFETTRLTFCRTLMHEGANFNPAEITLENYKLIGLTEKGKCGEIILFNPLLHLKTCGNQVLLDRIYAHARIHYTSRDSFGFQIGAPLRSELTKRSAVDSDFILHCYVNTQWALCTYQSVAAFEEQYDLTLTRLNDPKRDARLIQKINSKLLEYACKNYNTELVTHLALNPKYGVLRRACELDDLAFVRLMLSHGLNPKAIQTALPTNTSEKMKTLLVESGANALIVLKEGSTSREMVRHMLFRYVHQTHPEKAESILDAFKSNVMFYKLSPEITPPSEERLAAMVKPFL